MIEFEKAIQIIKQNVNISQASEIVDVSNSHKRVLNKSYISKYNIPRTNLSAMDGILVMKNNKRDILKIIGESKAGDLKAKKIKDGECILIFTGGPIYGEDKQVIPNENFKIKDGFVHIHTRLYNDYVRRTGSDLSKGKIYLRKDSIITIRSKVLALSMKLKNLNVKKKPKIFIICTGDEIIPKKGNQSLVASTNHIFIKFFVELFGGEVVKISYSNDDYKNFIKTFKSQKVFDFLITSGGISRGKYDIVKSSLKKNGLKILFDKVAVKPGKPTTFGKLSKRKYFLGLPGNPVSCLISMINFFPIFINAFYGINFINTSLKPFISKKFIKENNNLTQFQRVFIENTHFEIFNNQDSSLLNTLSLSDGILIRKPKAKSIKSGEISNIMLFQDLNNQQI